ncbi:hydroxymethylglutaryl-CoA synthase [Candidatus Woesearchaeota archaeon]|nr:hydroxymethylglutaryl-CoA synthase [Candidatus Woesearchaeota archaeon]
MAGIVGYGSYIPLYRIKTEEIARIWGKDPEDIRQGIGIDEISVGGIDEDSVTIAVEAASNALKRARIDKKKISAVYCGSESKVYAVKPNASIIGNALGIGEDYTAGDVEFACKAGSASLQICTGLVSSGLAEYGLAIGSDTSQARPGGGIPEYIASSGGAAFIVGNRKEEIVAEIEHTLSVTSDIPDFWRRNMQPYPRHGERFTGEKAYFKHTIEATKKLLDKINVNVSDVDHFVFHTPNIKFPMKIAKKLGVEKEKILAGLLVKKIGNAYSGSCMLGLSAVLDAAKPGERIVMTSFGSGAGSDSFSFKVTGNIEEKRDSALKTKDYIDKAQYIDYAIYCKYRGKILL